MEEITEICRFPEPIGAIVDLDKSSRAAASLDEIEVEDEVMVFREGCPPACLRGNQ